MNNESMQFYPDNFLWGKIEYFRQFLIICFTNIFLSDQVAFQLPACKLKTILVLNIVLLPPRGSFEKVIC